MSTTQSAAADPITLRRAPRRPRHLPVPPSTRHAVEPVTPAGPPPSPSDHRGVAYVFWPTESDRRATLAAEGRCRLLLLAADTPAPEVSDPLEDWIREPFEAGDLEARVLGIEARARRHAEPHIDADGVLHLHDRRTALSEPQRALVQLLLDHLDELVSLADLRGAHEGAGAVGSVEATSRSLQRCRAKLQAVGLELHTIRAKGFLLAVAPTA
jgi:hypothetical protein